MKIKELIEELKNYDGNMEILITSTDPTDYKYVNDFGGVDLQYFIDDDEGGYLVDEEDYEEDYIDEDGDDDGKGKKVLVVNGGYC